MSRILFSCVIFLIVGVCVSQVVKFGPCPVVETKQYFELEKFLGTWYEIERFPTWYEDFSSCGSKTIEACGRNIKIVHTFVKDGIEFIVHMNSTYAPGAEAVFEIQKNNVDPVGIPLSVIETDYQHYAVVYGCRYNETLNFKYLLTWILSRERTLHADHLETARSVLGEIPYANVAYLEQVEQNETKCSNYIFSAHVHTVNINNEN